MKRRFVLPEAEAMTSLVRMILADVVEAVCEQKECKRQWVEASMVGVGAAEYQDRRAVYLARERWLATRQRFERLRDELAKLGVELLDPRHGIAAFPFRWSKKTTSRRVRRAYFLLKLSDEPMRGIASWRFCGEREERRVPAHWFGQLSSPIVAELAY